VTFRKEKTMKRAALALLIAAGSATAEPSVDTPSDSTGMENAPASASTIYPVDEDRDGRSDRLLILEQSDSLA
jgi:predicted lipoprotein with Yx(FWY)xxD motif